MAVTPTAISLAPSNLAAVGTDTKIPGFNTPAPLCSLSQPAYENEAKPIRLLVEPVNLVLWNRICLEAMTKDANRISLNT